MSDSFVAPDDL